MGLRHVQHRAEAERFGWRMKVGEAAHGRPYTARLPDRLLHESLFSYAKFRPVAIPLPLGEGHSDHQVGTGLTQRLGRSSHRRPGRDDVVDKQDGVGPATERPAAGRELHCRSLGDSPSFLGTAHSTQHRRTTKATQTGVPSSESLGRVVTPLAAMYRRTGGPGDQGGS